MDLSIVTGFDWDAGNARKNEKHGVSQADIEQVFLNRPLVVTPDVTHSTAELRYHALGRTDANRWVHVTFTLRGSGTSIRPISAGICTAKRGQFMSKHLKPIPEFKTEAQERAFWEPRDNDSTKFVDWNAARPVALPNLRPSTRAISLRLPESLLATIRAQANRLDVPYQSLMKLWLAEKATAAAGQRTTRVPKKRAA